MKVTPLKVTIRDLTEDYFNDAEEGVTGYDNRLDIRPKYQREFVYKDAQRDEVIRTVKKNLPLNVMYWAKVDDDEYEVLDGQQRTISVCEYVDGSYSVDGMYFYNLPDDLKNQILNYDLHIYVCEGTPSQKLEWFKIINIAGEKLTDQELLNAVYAGPWVTDAKRYFSKSGGPAYQLADKLMKGSPIRQEYFETVLKWAADKDGVTLEEYMAKHQQKENAAVLWKYFRDIVGWVNKTFQKERKQMKGLPWGIYYNEHKDRKDLDPAVIEQEIKALMEDEEVTKKNGIYEYILTGNERVLSLRSFDEPTKRKAYNKQNGLCNICSEPFEYKQMHGDHITAWSKGGRTVESNLQMLCRDCNLKKSAQ